ncbi:MAG TPA: ABC transporter permease [Candidatus Limnocylindria bacterium]
MRIALVIAARILRQRLRDRTAIVFSVVTPLALALAFSMIIPDFTPDFHTTIVVVDNDGGQLAGVLVDDVMGHLVEADIADVERVPDEATARQRVDDEEAGVAVIVPAGVTPAIMSGTATEVRIFGSGVTAREIARASVTRFAQDVGAVQLTAATVEQAGGTLDAAGLQRITQAVAAGSPISVAEAGAENAQASLATFYGAAMAIMFVFFATQYGALAVLAERQAGTLSRLLAAPIPQAAIILGGALAGMGLGLIAMTVMVLATTLFVGASWGPPLLVAVLLLAAVFAAMGISAVVATLARNSEQAGNLNAIVALCLSAIGGVFIPLSYAPELMSRLAMVTPHAWFLRGIDALQRTGAGLVDILPSVGVLLGIGLVTASVGLLRARKALVAA